MENRRVIFSILKEYEMRNENKVFILKEVLHKIFKNVINKNCI